MSVYRRLSALVLLLGLIVSSARAQHFAMQQLGQLSFDVELSDIWGYVDEEGNEYALIGLNDNFSVVDVTDPANPEEVFRTIGGMSSAWRDVKTYGDHAYITCECGPGLLIVDLSPLPASGNLSYTYWNSDTMTFYKAHNLYIDDGVAYIFGADYSKGGAIMLDLTQDPMNPTPIGIYDEEYLHDGFVRNDTLWGAAIYLGEMQVIDVSDKANPELKSVWKTPGGFTHNAWLSDDSKHIFTTSEIKNGKIAAYDVSNILNPIEEDIWQVNDTSIIPHNAHWHNGFLVNSHYTIGVSIMDVSRPHNMVEVGRYDTSPDYTYEGFHGCWGVYPYLPSGNIIASDIETGLHILGAEYKRAAYLEGNVTDLHTGGTIFFPEITLIENDLKTTGNIVGAYATGTRFPGNFTVVATADGYFPDTIENVVLQNGEVTQLDIQLSNWPLGVERPSSDRAKFQAYPNPSADRLWLKLTEPMDFELIDVHGRVIRNFRLSAGIHQIERTQWNVPSGLYWLNGMGQDRVVSSQKLSLL